MTHFDDRMRPGWGSYGSPLPYPAAALAGVRTRRILAVGVDVCLVAILCTVVLPAIWGLLASPLGPVATFGGVLLSWFLVPIAFPVVAFFYNGLFVSSHGMGTPGMRIFDLEARATHGGRVDFLSAAIHGVCFYLTWMFPPLFLVSLATIDKSCLHDMLAQVRILRRSHQVSFR